MPLICPNCGGDTLANLERRPDSTLCVACGQRVPANIFPLFVVTGASGTGKTAVVPRLRCRFKNVVVFDKDLLWGRCGDQFYNDWLRIAYSIAQGGRYTLLAGIIMPAELDSCEDRWLVGSIHYINLHCNDKVREERLRARPAWRQCNDWFIEEHKRVAQRLLEMSTNNPALGMVTLDTSNIPVSKVVEAILSRIECILRSYPAARSTQFASTD